MPSPQRHRPTLGARGTTTAYRKGCRCPACTAANTRAKRASRERSKQRGSRPMLRLVTDVPPAVHDEREADGTEVQDTTTAAWGAMQVAVNADLASLQPDGRPRFNTLKASALALAREIDDIDSRTSKAPLVKQLVDVMSKLTGKESDGGNSIEDLLAGLNESLTGS